MSDKKTTDHLNLHSEELEMVDKAALTDKNFPECAADGLVFMRSNYARVPKADMVRIAHTYVFYNDYKGEHVGWTKKTNAMQDLQCVDCIVHALEAEK